jgi:hypothetical protein
MDGYSSLRITSVVKMESFCYVKIKYYGNFASLYMIYKLELIMKQFFFRENYFKN